MAYLFSGAGRFVQKGLPPRRVGSGDLIWVFPQIPHRYGPSEDQPWNEFYIVFDGPIIDLWLQEELISPRNPVWHLEPTSYWLRRFVTCAEEGQESGDVLQRVTDLQQLVVDAHKQHREQPGAGGPRWFSVACGMLAKPGGPGPEAVADELGIAYQTFRKNFAKLAGVPPAKYHSIRVIELACQMLAEADARLKRVAADCGFCDEFHFSRRFRQLMGISPAAYRERVRRR